MSRIAVIRHPDVAVAGICPEGALEFQRARGWYRVSDWTEEPGEFDLDTFGVDRPDLDAPPEKKTKTPAKPVDDEEQEA